MLSIDHWVYLWAGSSKFLSSNELGVTQSPCIQSHFTYQIVLGEIIWHGMIIAQILSLLKEQTFNWKFLGLEPFYTISSAWIRRIIFICYRTCSILPKLKLFGILLAFTLIQLLFPALKISFYSTLIRIGLSGIRKGNGKLHDLCLCWKSFPKDFCTMGGFETSIFHPFPPRVLMFKSTPKQRKLLSLTRSYCWSKKWVAGIDCN